MSDYAIVEYGGKQYRVAPGDELLVERQDRDLSTGDELVFDRVLLLGGGGEAKIGTPLVEGATVKGSVLSETRGKKLTVFKKKRRKGYKKTRGHRQDYYRVKVDAIES